MLEPNSQDSASVFAGIQAEYASFKEFHHLLQEEQAALTKGDIDRLLALAPRKNELLNQLSGFSNERGRKLSAAGHKNTSAGMEAWLRAIGADHNTHEIWRRLIELAREAEQINRENGILIEISLRHNQQALSVLKVAANPGTSLYGPNGQISSHSTGHHLGKV